MADDQLKRLIRHAPASFENLLDLLHVGLDWPIPPGELREEDLLDWQPEELQLDPEQVAKLTGIYQIPRLTTKQTFGAFYLQFEGGQLPIGAVRRLLNKLVSSKRAKGSGKHPTWDLNDLLFFCLSGGEQSVIHVVSFQESGTKRVLRVMSWTAHATGSRFDLLARRALHELAWVDESGPRVVGDSGDALAVVGYREGIRGARALSKRMADVAQDVRDEVRALLMVEMESGPMRSLFVDIRDRLLGDLTPDRFADVYAQTMVYGLLTARIVHPEHFQATRSLAVMQFDNPFLDAIYSRFRDDTDGVIDVDELGLGELAAVLAATNIDEILADFGSEDRREDPVVYFYEQFLAQYDPRQRIDAGAFYTPVPVVKFMTRAVDHLLKSRFGLPLGTADDSDWATVCEHLGIDVPDGVDAGSPFVAMADPATGTGTFLMEWIRSARESFLAHRAADQWPDWFAWHVGPMMHAFEIMLAPYAIANLKVAIESKAEGVKEPEATILLTDTLQHPAAQASWDFEEDPISLEAARANGLKLSKRFTVVIGNPPYNREQGTSEGDQRHGGIVRFGVPGVAPLIEALTKPMSDAGQGVHIKNLYNDYVYFWRWATWRATEHIGHGPGIVAMITPLSYLSGKSMSGLRAHLRTVFDDFYVIDLGGEGRGANAEENVFDIRTPVAIGIGVRRTARSRTCDVRYVRVRGTRSEKLDWLEREFADVEFEEIPGAGLDSFAPAAGGDYGSWPRLDELMPWSHSGSQVKRSWPINADPEVLQKRWDSMLASADRAAAFKVSRDRTLASTPLGLTTRDRLAALSTLQLGASHEPVVRYGYRSFDRQFLLADARLADYPRPELWAVRGEDQIYLTTLTSTSFGRGPVMSATPYVPDLHHFNNRGAKDVFPMWRDAAATDANLGAGLLNALRVVLGENVDPHRVFQYLYGIGGTAAFSDRFSSELAVAAGPVHIPLTKDRVVFDEVAALGEELLAWHTWGERYMDGAMPSGPASEVVPVTGRPDSFSYDSATMSLTVGNGRIAPVSPEVWNFEVSGFNPLQKWLGYRKAQRAGRTSSPLDMITYDEWAFTDELLLVINVLQHTIDLTPRAAALLDRVVSGGLFTAGELS
ncbi:type ISP restriction/modification enzyme [Microbacterium kyungheense]|nr:type ISP restriction/modification enzyme [Microbacterium kyungheense]